MLPSSFELGDLETLPTHGRGTRGAFSPWSPALEARKAGTWKKWSRNGCKWDMGKVGLVPNWGALPQCNTMTICYLVTDWLFCYKINPNYFILTWNYFEENLLFLFWELQANLQGLQKLYFCPPPIKYMKIPTGDSALNIYQVCGPWSCFVTISGRYQSFPYFSSFL